MNPRSIEATGKTVKEAMQKGCAQLGVDSADVDIQVLEVGTPGLFGLFGKPPTGSGIHGLRVPKVGGLTGQELSPCAEAGIEMGGELAERVLIDFSAPALPERLFIPVKPERFQVPDNLFPVSGRAAQMIQVFDAQKKPPALVPCTQVREQTAGDIAQVHGTAGRGRKAADGFRHTDLRQMVSRVMRNLRV